MMNDGVVMADEMHDLGFLNQQMSPQKTRALFAYLNERLRRAREQERAHEHSMAMMMKDAR